MDDKFLRDPLSELTLVQAVKISSSSQVRTKFQALTQKPPFFRRNQHLKKVSAIVWKAIFPQKFFTLFVIIFLNHFFILYMSNRYGTFSFTKTPENSNPNSNR